MCVIISRLSSSHLSALPYSPILHCEMVKFTKPIRRCPTHTCSGLLNEKAVYFGLHIIQANCVCACHLNLSELSTLVILFAC